MICTLEKQKRNCYAIYLYLLKIDKRLNKRDCFNYLLISIMFWKQLVYSRTLDKIVYQGKPEISVFDFFKLYYNKNIYTILH